MQDMDSTLNIKQTYSNLSNMKRLENQQKISRFLKVVEEKETRLGISNRRVVVLACCVDAVR